MRKAHDDVSPPGWSGTTEAMKKHGEISNPFALAWYMHEQGFHPHDAMNNDVLDSAHEMFQRAGHDDGTPYLSAGAKAGNDEPDLWEKQTENNEPLGEESEMQTDDDDGMPGEAAAEETMAHGHALKGHPSLRGHAMHGAAQRRDPEDDDEKLLDDSEVGSGEHLAGEHAHGEEASPTDPSVGGSAAEGASRSISDPVPAISGADPIEVEGEETNDDDDYEDEADDDDDEADDE